MSEEGDIKIPITLYLLGPGTNTNAYVLQRKILKSASYKNWRLNGEFIYPPEDNPERFNVLKPNDIAVMGFEGLTTPKALYIVFISANNSSDLSLHRLFNEILGPQRKGMSELTSQQLQEIVTAAGVPDEHPINKYVISEDVLEAIQGNSESQLRAYRRSGRTMSQDEVKSARQKVEKIGELGEDLLAHYLDEEQNHGDIKSVEWTSRNNAIAPFDFKVEFHDGSSLLIDAKTTTGEFSVPLHISMAEIETMATSSSEYALYRIYKVSEREGLLRIASNMREYAVQVKNSLVNLPAGTRVDSISCNPCALNFGSSIKIGFYEEAD